MSHQSELEKRKYRNWVRGALAYKYLKQGLSDFSDDVVKQEQIRILSTINCTPGTSCNQCSIERLRPIHACKTNSAGINECFWGQHKCNCLQLKKQRCRLKICDFIMEEILKSHGSTPPTPNWANTDMQKWCTDPWEVAKCFINAPGYFGKTNAADIDISGLLLIFINDTNLHSHLACSMAGKNVFIKVRERRNKLFHSATMEMEEGEVDVCINDIVEILEDPKELKGKPGAQEAVNKLKQLKESKFVITTNDEVDVCKEALVFVRQKSDELKQITEDGKKEVRYVINQDMAIAKESIQKCQNDAVKEFNEYSKILHKRVKNLETDIDDKVEKLKRDISERVGEVESDISVLKSDVSSVKDLKESKFVITSNDEVDVSKEATMCLSQKTDEFKNSIKEMKGFNERVHNLETNMSEKVDALTTDISERIGKVESDISVLQSDVSSVIERVTELESKVKKLDSKRDIYKKFFNDVKWKQVFGRRFYRQISKTVQIFIPILTPTTEKLLSEISILCRETSYNCIFCYHIGELLEEFPLIVVCPMYSRLEPDIDFAIYGIHWTKPFAVLLLHTGLEKYLPILPTSVKLPHKEEYKNAEFIDIAYNTDANLYQCQMNETARIKLNLFLQTLQKKHNGCAILVHYMLTSILTPRVVNVVFSNT